MEMTILGQADFSTGNFPATNTAAPVSSGDELPGSCGTFLLRRDRYFSEAGRKVLQHSTSSASTSAEIPVKKRP